MRIEEGFEEVSRIKRGLARQRLGIDDQPGLTLRRQHIAEMKISIHQHWRNTRLSEVFTESDCPVQQVARKWPAGTFPGWWHLEAPAGNECRDCGERMPGS